MEIKSVLKDSLIIEDKPMLRQLLFLAVALAGISLWIGSVKEYGFQAWYRFFYMTGIVFFIVGIAGLVLYSITTRITINALTRSLIIEKASVLAANTHLEIPLSDIHEFEVETHKKDQKTAFRVIAHHKSGEISPVTEGFFSDFASVEQVAKMMNRYL